MLKFKMFLALFPLFLFLSAEARQLNEGDFIAGGNVGLALGWGGLTVGGSFERGIVDDVADNINLSAGLTGIYTSYTYTSTWSVSHTFIGAMVNLNYYTPDLDKLQPYGGLIVGYNLINVEGGYSGSYGSGLGVGAQIGTRYYLSEPMALNFRLGFPVTSIGLDYRF
jgi:hypothetical protein